MNAPTRTFIAMLALTVLAAGMAGWIGVQYGIHKSQPDLDTLIHARLHLTPTQEYRINSLEDGFATRRSSMQAEMDAANRELSDAMARDHTYGPAETHAVSRFHAAMMQLQEDTIRHVLAMRAVLSPHQAAMFDRLVAEDLSQPAP